ncbi:MAG TPA: hypothetical protein VMF65_13145 [Acidimicrobiales bacterium]|nr:hypothetical protein [Acidimicrobiales bacterium]
MACSSRSSSSRALVGGPFSKSVLLNDHWGKIGVPASEVVLMGGTHDDFVTTRTIGTRFVAVKSGYESGPTGSTDGIDLVANLVEAVRRLGTSGRPERQAVDHQPHIHSG